MKRRNGWWCMCLGVVLVGACDRSPAPPTPTASNPPVEIPEEPPRPTTQELMQGEYIQMPLADLPLTAAVPASWTIQHNGPITTLEGFTPTDRAVIQLAQRNSITNEQFKPFIDSLRGDHQEKGSSPYNRFELRQVGDTRLLERSWAYDPVTSPQTDSYGKPTLDEQGNVISITSTPMRWTMTVFVPGDSAWAQYELNCIGMTTEQYDAGHELISKVLTGVKPKTAP